MKSHTVKLFLLISIILLVACETQPIKPEQVPTVEVETPLITEQADALIIVAEDFLQRALNSDAIEEQLKYRALAASAFIEAGEINLAKQQLEMMTQTTAIGTESGAGFNAQSAQASISLLATEIAIAENKAALANQILLTISPASHQQKIKLYALTADLDFLYGKYMLVVKRRVQLDNSLTEQADKEQNHKKIWAALSSIPSPQLNRQHSDNAIIKGWLELAKVMRAGQRNISKLEDELLDWGMQHPLHPVGNDFLSELVSHYQSKLAKRKQIAVILPMRGNLSAITATIKNGFLSAYFHHSAAAGANTAESHSPIKPIIKFYDSSNKELSFQQLYQQAIDDGASNIIGPLDKTSINQLLQQTLDIPVLTLNYSEHSSINTDNLFQFGLSPIDEARQVAELAIRQNKFVAAVFYPDSEWGKRLNVAFTEHYEILGGTVASVTNYATNTKDYSRPIRTLLNLEQSDIRRRRVENTISQKTQSEARRRQDIDMIFLVATHHSARGIMPAFKFHHAGDLPVYSTSHVYAGKSNRDLDRDLNGLVFCDIPWVLQNTSPLENVFTQNWPQQKSLTRLFALGIDAYHLIYNLDYLQNKNYAFFDGQTGNIRLDENNRITRKLLWAKFERGRAVYFEPAPIEPALVEPAIAERAGAGDRPRL